MKVLFVVVLAVSCSFYLSEACTSGGILIKGDEKEVKLGQGKKSKSEDLASLSLEDTKHLSITSVLDEALTAEDFDEGKVDDDKIQVIFQIGCSAKPNAMAAVMSNKCFNKMDKRFFKKLRKHVKRILKKMDPVEVSLIDFELLLGEFSVDLSGIDWAQIAPHMTAESFNTMSLTAFRRLPFGLIKNHLAAGELEQVEVEKVEAVEIEYVQTEIVEAV